MKYFRITAFGFILFIVDWSDKAGWFRLFGRGLKWKHVSQGLLFSERNGYSKYLKIGDWVAGYLPESNIIKRNEKI